MRIATLGVLLLMTTMLRSQPAADIVEYVNAYKKIAIDEEQRAGVPAAITLAQGIHETQAGKSDLVLSSNNHFGIKCKAFWTGDRVFHDDDSRGECFRKYPQAADSYRDHSDFLRGAGRYNFLFQLDPTDYKAWAYGLKKAGYATNPKYAPIIVRLIEDYNLEQYTLLAMGKMKPEEEVVLQLPTPAINLPVPVSPLTDTSDAIAEPAAEIPSPPLQYPSGEFSINNTRVIFAKEGTSLLSIAQQYDIPLSHLMDYNDLGPQEVLDKDQLLYLQRKRKTGNNEFHVVASGESLYDICQKEAIRLDNLLDYNHLQRSMQPAVGEKLYLQGSSPSRSKQ